jgi:DNA-directed RNA polymerase subunit RPC12/RpoP
MTAAVEAEQRTMTLQRRVSELEKEIMELNNWQREAERYQLAEVTPGVPAYVVKPGMENGEPTHYLCANCFARYEKSFLQHLPFRPEQMRCSHCNAEFAPSKAPEIRITRL